VQSTVGNKNSLIPMSNEYSVNDVRCLVMYALNKVDTQKDFFLKISESSVGYT